MPSPPPSPDLRLERAAACLSPLERRVLELSAADGLDNEAIADRLGISRRRVERLLARALVKFDRALDSDRRPWWRFW
ncbi:MAG: helix-turn-helix transcriptional regulator [Pseudomonadota bacterium]